ncbi:glycosyltransferase family 2 protein [Myroides ceti]|uniref:Glycosyltransferase family 2 protein n=1 Tax=Paenimyroides ceti TaxID=395087 RepID=A0ABT8D5H2_9FLAO|nr:glycosyltransferase family 2 protein [Paenimyroides ceti]MDN3708619.1 glycosyltransferase family 2 protein [Paenimyroides ceti]MDN3710484.1 glycosyltransferase family 2 protein [Paenimyroides ceti]
MKQICIIVPVYNEELSIDTFFNTFLKFNEALVNKGYSASVLFVDDGSKDKTPTILNHLITEHTNCKALIFSRNFGKEAALFAGLEHAEGDLMIPMDVDLQDPFELIFEMLTAYEKGADVVLARRANRETDTVVKRFSAQWFYRLNNKMSTLKLEENVGDFRLMTRKVVNEIVSLQENQLFMKGLMSWVGFETTVVNYSRPGRTEGKTKFNYIKLWNLAVQGITSFSTLPLKVWTYFGSFIAFISFLYGLKIIIEKLFFGINASGYASLMVAILFFGGVQLIGIGVLGEYLGRTYLESKRRPRYIIKHKIDKKHE